MTRSPRDAICLIVNPKGLTSQKFVQSDLERQRRESGCAASGAARLHHELMAGALGRCDVVREVALGREERPDLRTALTGTSRKGIKTWEQELHLNSGSTPHKA